MEEYVLYLIKHHAVKMYGGVYIYLIKHHAVKMYGGVYVYRSMYSLPWH
jgi:hypothetical protein